MKKLYIFLLAGIIATVSSCTYTFPEDEAPTAGTADFTKVVAVGNSLTAGLMNAALYNEGQNTSYANLVAQQMKFVGGGDFKQPDINSENGVILSFLPGAIVGRLVLQFQITQDGATSPAPAPIGLGEFPMSTYSGEVNNFGVPSMRIVEASLDGYGTLNPYFGRFASSPTTSVLADAMAANGTFILFWLGGNDVLGYATGGATGNVDGDGTNPNDMTSVPLFEGAYRGVLGALTDGKKGIVANIPNIGDIPHFTTVPWNAIPMDQATADATNAGFTAFNGGIKAYNAGLLPGQTEPPTIKRDTIGFSAGNNGIVIADISIPDLSMYGIPSMRQATSNDLITLPAGGVLGKLADPNNPASVIGVGVPLDEKYTLTEQNQIDIANRVKAYNDIILAEVEASNGNLVLLDINEVFHEIAQNGVIVNGAGLDASITPPLGGFSLDGIHPNSRGAAYLATLFIDRINEAFSANIPNLNPNEYSGNELPQLTP